MEITMKFFPGFFSWKGKFYDTLGPSVFHFDTDCSEYFNLVWKTFNKLTVYISCHMKKSKLYKTCNHPFIL